MALYLIMIYEDEEAWANIDPAEAGQVMAAHQEFGETNAAVLRGGNALQPAGGSRP